MAETVIGGLILAAAVAAGLLAWLGGRAARREASGRFRGQR